MPTAQFMQDPLMQVYSRNGFDTYDEMFNESGQVKPHWYSLLNAIQQLGTDELGNRNHEISRIMRENGVTYSVYGDEQGLNRTWQLDPIPFIINQNEWEVMERGLKQRAELLNSLVPRRGKGPG
ncbi:MAG: hypothetical protein K2Q22_10345 [Cytophagales bacterium]|nr:hypothetical protein [Cytophagales bacterium]